MKKIKYFFKSLTISIKLKSTISLILDFLGLGMAFFPMLISLQLEQFTNNTQRLAQDSKLIVSTLLSFAILLALYIGQTVFGFIRGYFNSKDSAKVSKYLQIQMMELLSTIPYKYIENYDEFRKKYDFVTSNASGKVTGSIAIIFTWIANIISFVSVSVVLYKVSPFIVLILIVTSIPAVFLSLYQKDADYRYRTKFMKEGRFVLTYSEDCRRNESMKEIRFFGLYPYFKAKWKRLGKEWIDKKNKIIRKHVIINSIADLLRNGVYLFVIIFTVKEIYSNPSTGIGIFMLVIAAAGQLQSITATLLINTMSVFTDLRYIQDFFDLLETERENINEEAQGYTDVSIEFDNVSFSYPNSELKALDGVSVKIKQGEKIAVVGANGSGKSTFVNLLCGLYEPESGHAMVNGKDIWSDISNVRKSISVVFQRFCQYQDTIKNNINISVHEHSEHEDDEIINLMKQTGADEILDINADINAMIGLFSEDGKNLSGGQWQKIAITRALFKRDAAMYILDEPTAALDPLAEANIYRNFASLTQDKTTILVSHRLGITSVVDRILVFDNGKIVEDGSFDELIAFNGLFAQMYDAQAQWYKEKNNENPA